jgi:hypothetical protein
MHVFNTIHLFTFLIYNALIKRSNVPHKLIKTQREIAQNASS